MQTQNDQSAIGSKDEASLQGWLRRFWPFYCLLAALSTLGYAFWDSYQIDGDAVSYMDIGDLIRGHHWAGVVNGYWNPLYPAFLALGHTLFHATRYTELHACYMVNYGIFLLEMLAIVAFTDALICLRDARAAIASTPKAAAFLLDRYALRYLGIALLVIAAQRELSMGKVRPDALLQACLLFGMAALLRYCATGRLRYAALMGVAFGLAYLTKSFALAFTIFSVATLISFCVVWLRRRPARTIAAAVLAAACFAVVAGPYIAALSRSRGRIDFGDSGGLNYAWYVGGTEKMHLQPGDTALFGSAQVHLRHPEKVLLQSPEVLSYKLLPYGTYPDWFDTSFWNERIVTHFNPRGEVHTVSRDFVLVDRYLVNHPESWLLLAVLFVLGSRLDLGWRPGENAFWLVPVALGLLVFAIYGLVNIEERYVTVGFFAIMLSLFGALRPSASQQRAGSQRLASSLVLLLALLAVGESARVIAELRRDLNVAGSPAGWYDAEIFQAAHGLNAMGVGPGDAIACVGTRACLYDPYWARLAGVRILTEIYLPKAPLYPQWTAIPNRELAIDTVRRQGAKVLVGYFSPGLMTGTTPPTAGWRELGESHFYALPLNLPQGSAANQSSAHQGGADSAAK